MLIFLLLLIQIVPGDFQNNPQTEAEKEQELVNYVIELYYYPNKPNIVTYNTPEEYPLFKKRHYFYDFITCLHKRDFLGIIDALVHSNTICISLCDEYPECKGGVYYKDKRKCFLLKYVPCASEAELQLHGTERDIWQVFFFYKVEQCKRVQPGDQQCGERTTTPTPEVESATESIANGETEKEGIAEGQGVKDQQGISENIEYSIAITVGQAQADAAKRVAAITMDNRPRFVNRPTGSPTKYYELKRESTASIKMLVSYATSSDMDIDKQLDMLEEQEAKSKVAPAREADRRRNPSPPRQQQGLPEVDDGGVVKLPDVPSEEPSGKVTFTKKCKKVALPNRRKRYITPMSLLSCRDFVGKLRNTIGSLQKKINYVKNFKGNLLETVREKIRRGWNSYKTKKLGVHMSKVSKAGQVAAYGLLAGNLLNELLEGHFDKVAMNVGFFVFAYANAKASEKLAELSAKFLAKGHLKFGWLLRAASPLLTTLSTAFVVYSFYQSIKNLNTSDSDTIAEAVASGILLGVQLFELGVFILATAGLISATGVLASVAGPIGIFVGAAVLAGLQIYNAVKHVEEIQKVLKLTSWEVFLEGGKRFFTNSGTESIKKLYEEKSANNHLREAGIEILKNNTSIQYCFLPTAIKDGSNIQLAQYKTIEFRQKKYIYYSRSSPQTSYDYESMCLPSVSPDDSEGGRYDFYCRNAFGIKKTNYNSEMGIGAHYELGNGDDQIFAANMSNTYTLGNGQKDIVGNDNQDIFILYGNTTSGTLDGLSGYNMIYAEHFHKNAVVNYDIVSSDKNEININHYELNKGERKSIKAKNIIDIRGRPNAADIITVPCGLKFLNLNGGEDMIQGRDIIYLQEECNYNISIVLGPNTVLTNEASNSTVFYHLAKLFSNYFISLKKGKQQRNIFIFDYNVENIGRIKTIDENFVILTINDASQKKPVKISIREIDQDTIFVFKNNIHIQIHIKNIYMMLVSDLGTTEIRDKYKNLIEKHGFILKAKSTLDSMVLIDAQSIKKDSKEIALANDQNETTYFIPSSGKNVFVIGTEDSHFNEPYNNFVIPNVEIDYEKGVPNIEDIIELRFLNEKIQRAYNLSLEVKATLDYQNRDIIILLYLEDSDRKFVHQAGTIILKNTFANFAYNNIIIGLHSGLTINITESVATENDISSSDINISLLPIPLMFNLSEHEVILLHENDVAYDSDISFDTKLGEFDYYAYMDNLIITNAAAEDDKTERLFSLVLHNFFNSKKMQSLNLDFQDIFLSLKANTNLHGLLKLPDKSEMINQFQQKIDISG